MRVLILSTHRADRAHYAPLIRLLEADPRFHVMTGFDPTGDVAIALGDRSEMLMAAAESVRLGVRLVHIHGGEHTYGSLDERWRWALTTIADEHCVAHEAAADSLAIWGVTLDRIHITGAPGLDDIIPRQRPAYPHRLVIHYNPVIHPAGTMAEFQAIIQACGFHTPDRLMALEESLWVKMNGDRGSVGRGEELEPNAYRDELAAAHVIVGNSSAGIIEAPSLGTWAVNVGERQSGRVRAGNVINVPANGVAIRRALVDAFSRPRFVGPNPYGGDGHASERIRDVLLSM